MDTNSLKEWYQFSQAFEEIFNKAAKRIIELMAELDEYEHTFNDEVTSHRLVMNEKGQYTNAKIEKVIIERKFDQYSDLGFKNVRIKYSTDIFSEPLSFAYHFRDVCNIINKLEEALNYADYEEPKECFSKVHIENEDIIITDPCYIFKHMSYEEENEISNKVRQEIGKEKMFEDFSLAAKLELDTKNLTHKQLLGEYNALCEYKEYKKEYDKKFDECLSKYRNSCHDLTKLGFTDYIENNTYYGDWSCTTFETDENGEVIENNALGQFCADSGMVAVLKLSEVLKHNPDFNYHIEKPWTTTLIKNFTGDVWLKKTIVKGEMYTFVVLNVIGKGTTNFITKQTGM